MTKEQLVSIFANSVIEQNAASSSRKGNQAARICLKAFEDLVREYGDSGREELTTLFDHPDAAVRCMAAAFLMRYCTDRATEVLEHLASGTGLAALGVECTLENWANGDWELDLDDQDLNP